MSPNHSPLSDEDIEALAQQRRLIADGETAPPGPPLEIIDEFRCPHCKATFPAALSPIERARVHICECNG